MQWFLKCLQNYAVFKGRARRKEFWMFVLFFSLGSWAILFVAVLMGKDVTTATMLAYVFQLALGIPQVAVAVRRMHDLDRSGWFFLIPLYGYYLACLDGTEGDNRFGPDPKDRSQYTG
jgi:uncharacterized membrane protein YhaH (DUF805 family)